MRSTGVTFTSNRYLYKFSYRKLCTVNTQRYPAWKYTFFIPIHNKSNDIRVASFEMIPVIQRHYIHWITIRRKSKRKTYVKL